MLSRDFTKEEFTLSAEKRYQIEFTIKEIGEGSNLTIERKKEDGEYETIQAEVTRSNDSIFINWSEPFNGRLIFEK